MKFLAYFRSLAAKFFHRRQIEDDMEEELRSHVQHRADDLERSGLARAEAERRARLEFGGREGFREECREALGGNFIETLIQDVRYYLDLRDRNRVFDGLAAYNVDQAGLDTGENPSRVWIEEVSGNYFDVLRIQPYLGRFIHGSDEHGPDSAPSIVLTYAYWHVHFQDDRAVLGRTVQLNRHPFTIVGVAPPGFHGTLWFLSPDFFLPIVNQQQVAGVDILNARGIRSGFCRDGTSEGWRYSGTSYCRSELYWLVSGKTYPKDDGPVNFRLALPSFYGSFLGPPVRAFVTGLILPAWPHLLEPFKLRKVRVAHCRPFNVVLHKSVGHLKGGTNPRTRSANHVAAQPMDTGSSACDGQRQANSGCPSSGIRYGGKGSKWVKKSSPALEIGGEHSSIIGLSIRESEGSN